MWLETVLIIEVVAAFWLSAMNMALLGRMISSRQGRPRRAAAFVLACVYGAQAMEALVFLGLDGTAAATQGWQAVLLLVVRTALLLSTALVSALLLRALARSR